MTRAYARSLCGHRAHDAVPLNPGSNVTFTMALRGDGLLAPWMHTGAADGASVETYVRTQLRPLLRPREVVVLDTLASHKRHAVRAAVEARGAHLLLLPPYSPDLNPIERAGSKVKASMKKAGPRTWAALLRAAARAVASITANDARGFFRHSGYRLKPS